MARKRDALCQRIDGILRQEFPSDTVDVSLSGIRDNVHVLVVSQKLNDFSETQKQEHIWDILERGGLGQDELGRISLILPLSVQELQR